MPESPKPVSTKPETTPATPEHKSSILTLEDLTQYMKKAKDKREKEMKEERAKFEEERKRDFAELRYQLRLPPDFEAI